MIILLSPAKKQAFETPAPVSRQTQPQFKLDIAELIPTLQSLSQSQLSQLMNISDKIAELNFKRFNAFDLKQFNRQNAKQALYAFKGDAYQALDAETLDEPAIDYLQSHLLILSGLYGLLRPLDLMQPYRLEMKTPLLNPRGKTLYDFWGDKLTKKINSILKNHKNRYIINLSSSEYGKAVIQSTLDFPVINIVFKEKKGGSYKVIGISAKRARGAMTRFLAQKRIEKPAEIKKFNTDGYRFSVDDSDDATYVFLRD